MNDLAKVRRNSAFNFSTIIFQKAISFFVIIVLARYLGAEGYGEFSFIMSFTALFAIFGDFGINFLTRREVARDKNSVNERFSNALALKLIMNLGTFILIMAFAYILGYSGEQKTAIMLGAFFVTLMNISPIKSIFEAYERMNLKFWVNTSKIGLRALLIFYLVFSGKDLLSILSAFVIMEIIMLITEIIIYHTQISKICMKIKPSTWKNLLRRATPFGVAALFMTIYDKVDVTMMSKLITDPDLSIGWYSSSYELMSALALLPGAFTGALAPIAYRSFKKNTKLLKRLYSNTFKVFLAISVPLAVGGTLLADQIIHLIYGPDFSGAVIALQVLIWAVIFNFNMFALGLALNSLNREHITMRATIYSVIFNVAANFILIPIMGYVGAAITTVLSVIIYSVYCYRDAQKSLIRLSLTRILSPIITSCFFMSVFIFLTKSTLHVLISIPLGAMIYLAVLYYTKGVTKEMILFLKEIFTRSS